MRRGHWLIVVSVGLATAGWVAACGSSEIAVPPGGGGNAAGGTGGNTGPGGSGFGGYEAGSGCLSNADCDGGVCLPNGDCCSADKACGELCCEQSQVCLLNSCIEPGNPCLSAADCPDGSYCEPALGEQTDGGVGDAGGPDANCTQPLPASGLCLPLPPVCTDGGVPDGGCIPLCEDYPPPGKLNATVKWQWGYAPAPATFPESADVWATPAVARVYDANCDGDISIADPPNVVFVSGNAEGSQCAAGSFPDPKPCKKGVLRMLDGTTGQEIWSLDKATPSSVGFAALSVALGDVDGDQKVDVIAMTGEGHVAVITDAWNAYDGQPKAIYVSDQPTEAGAAAGFGWGGGIALGDMDGDGHVEIAYGRSVFNWTGHAGSEVQLLWEGDAGRGVGQQRALSYFADLDEAPGSELRV